jgi:hypothetical protein
MMLHCEEPGCDYEIDETEPNAKSRLGVHRWSAHRIKGDGTRVERSTGTPTSQPVDDDPSPFNPPAMAATGEVPPSSGRSGGSAGAPSTPRRRGLLERFKRAPKEPGQPAGPGAPPTKPPKPSFGRGKRESGAETISDGWSALGGLFLKANHTPTGRVIQFQSDAAGEMLDEVVKGTPLDRLVLQRVVGARGTLDTLAALFGPPILTYRMEQAVAQGNQEAFSFFEGLLKSNIKRALPLMIPAMKKVKKRETEAAAALVDMLDIADLDALGLHVENGQPVNDAGEVVDVGDVFVGMLFADWVATVPPPAPSPEPQEAPA